MVKLDTLDKKLLQFLQADAKITHKELSGNLKLSVTAVYERIKKLERSGVIAQYVTLLDRKSLDVGFQVFCHVKLAKHEQEAIKEFEREVKSLDQVLECYHVSGDYDYLLKVIVKDMEDFREFMISKLTTLNCIGSTQSSFTISEVKNTTAIQIL